ncbi:MAG: 3-phosphoshikimate 1-carboxyvinyltransferase [bacterium]
MKKLDDSLLQGGYRILPSGALRGAIRVPGDKSISHRAVMLASLAEGTSLVRGFLESADCIATLNAFQKLGIESEHQSGCLAIHGRGLRRFSPPREILDMGNSGTGARLLLGILSGQPFSATITGDSSLRGRPMKRVTEPLSRMGAKFTRLDEGFDLPLRVEGGALHGIEFQSPVASAQVKSALLLAGLFAQGRTVVEEPALSRDHTERMLETFGVTVERGRLRCAVSGGQTLTARDVRIPGDFSSAAFFMAAAAIRPGSDLVIQEVGVNPTRTGLLHALRAMGAHITLRHLKYFGAEPVADIHVNYAPLHGTRVEGELVVRMIDEFPIFAVAAACASSPSVVTGAEELRVKESDRIAVIVEELGKFGVGLREYPDGFEVRGGTDLTGAQCFAHGDHRVAMGLSVAGLAAKGETWIQGTAPVATSFPGFFDLLNELSGGRVECVS